MGQNADAFGLPAFEGVYIFDPSAVAAFAKDFGRNVKMMPLGVLQPKNASDVQLLLKHAQINKTPVAIRGTVVAAYGQTQVQDGYLIDTSSLNQLTWVANDIVKLGPGMIWRDVVALTFPKGYVPAVLPDTIVTSVGGPRQWAELAKQAFALVQLSIR
jgi:FAD/FMN-containing dehydrogenase